MASGTVKADPLFLGLTRPSMIFGVTYVYASLNALASLMAFVITNNMIYLFVLMPVLHCIAYFICLKDPLSLELLMMKMGNFNVCYNKISFNGANSYDVY